MNRRGLFKRLAAVIAAPIVARLPVQDETAEVLAQLTPAQIARCQPGPQFPSWWMTNNAQGYVNTTTPFATSGPITTTANARAWMNAWNERPPDEDAGMVPA